MPKNQLTTTNQNSKLVLTKSKNLLDITNKILSNRSSSLSAVVDYEIFVQKGHTYPVWLVAISSDSRYIVSRGNDKTIKLWDLQSGEMIRTFEVDRYMSISITNDGKCIVSGCRDETILWDLQSGEMIRKWNWGNDSVVISNDGRYIVWGNDDWEGMIVVWDLKSNEVIRNFKERTEGANAVAISSDSRHIVSCDGHTIKLWDLQSGKEIRSFIGDTYNERSVAISSDSRYIVACDDCTIKLWNLQSGEMIRTFEGHTALVLSVAISSDNRFIVSGSFDVTIKLWDLQSGEVIRTFEGHTDWVRSVAISSDSRYIVSGSNDGTIKLWSLNDNEEIYTINNFKECGVCMTPDKYFSCGEEGIKYINQRETNPLDVTAVSDKAFKRYHRPDIIRERVQSVKKFDYKASSIDEIKTIHMDEDEIPF